MVKLSESEIERLLRPYNMPISRELAEKIRAYISLLLKWNRTISLTAIIDPIEILRFHFGESFFAASAVNFDQSRLADVGSGAGFPGMPLAMAIPTLNVTLIESNAKKCAFLAEAVRELEVSNIRVFRGRMEDYPRDSERFDYIAARALGHHEELLTWARMRLSASGQVVLWIGDEGSQDLSLDSNWNWNERVIIPGSERRFLLVGTPKN